MWVLKLGGSLARSPELPLWLDALAATDALIVPGGGPFADGVRSAQRHWAFDDRTAHDMAILAMHQFGRMLVGLNPSLRPLSGLADLEVPASGPRVWLPLPDELNAQGIPPSWQMTSDSLAAWLAGHVRADHLLLVKSARLAPGTGEKLEALSRLGVVDGAFPVYCRAGAFSSWLSGPDQHGDLALAFSLPEAHFTAIVP